MLLQNIGYAWSLDDKVDGIIFNASGFTIEQALRRDNKPDVKEILFDPQLYLSGLDGTVCNKTCAKLSTYDWFGVNIPEYDSSAMNQKEWMDKIKQSLPWTGVVASDPKTIKRLVRDCIDFQYNFGVTKLIAPTPLAIDSTDNFSTQLQWLDAAVEIKKRYSIPMLATIALSDTLLAHNPADLNNILTSILDNISSREEFDGIYLVVSQDLEISPRFINPNTIEAIFSICYYIGHELNKVTITNFMDLLGFICLGIGASGFGSGYTNKSKRLKLDDYTDSDGGSSYPKFYSHALISDLYSERDLNKIVLSGLLPLLSGDSCTKPGKLLLDTLSKGGTANQLPPWRETKNNVATAKTHRTGRVYQAVSDLYNKGNPISVISQDILSWLNNATQSAHQITAKTSISDDPRHVAIWNSSYSQFLINNSI